MENKINNLDDLLEWINEWRKKHGITSGKLQGSTLEQFVSELQEAIVNYVGDFGPGKGYENATLFLYTDADWQSIGKYCENSNGQYYMINQTKLGFIWDANFREAVKNAIGEIYTTDPITAHVLEGKEYSADGKWTRLGNTATESGNYLALDDFVSSQVAKAGVERGKVVYIIGKNASKDSVGLLTEIPSVLNETARRGLDVTKILTVAENFRTLPNGSCAYDAIAINDSNLYFNENGTVKYLDIWGKAGGSVPGIKTTYGQYTSFVNDATAYLEKHGYSVAGPGTSCSPITEYFKGAKVYFGENGEVVAISCKDGLIGTIPENYIYETTFEVCSNFENDAFMLEKYGVEFEKCSPSEKLIMKELDYYWRAFMDGSSENGISFYNYLKGSGKNVTQLNDLDKMIIRFCSEHSNPEWLRRCSEFLEKPAVAKLIKGGKIALAGAGIILTGYMVYQITADVLPKAADALERGDYFEAFGIVAGGYGGFAAEMWVGMEVMSYFTGAGMALYGPLGAVGGFILGLIADGIICPMIGDFTNWLCQETGKFLDNMCSLASSLYEFIVGDPLVLDLDGDGFELLSVKDGVYFDADAKGLAEKTEWVSSDDALLAIDLNGDGIINDGTELFGTSTYLADGTKAKDGFSALAQYDANKDGAIDSNDEVFNKLKVWQDKNSDGISQSDELYSLDDLGIQSISLENNDKDGHNVANVTYMDGTLSQIGEFDFEAHYYDSIETGKIEISEEISNLPDVQGMGDVPSLHTIMQLDETGTVQSYVEAFAQSNDRREKEVLIVKILYYITGADSVLEDSRGYQFDAKKLTVIEKFLGRNYVGTAGANPVNTAAPILEELYLNIVNMYYSLLNAQTHLKPFLSMTFWEEDEHGKRVLNTQYFDTFVSLCKEQGGDLSSVVAEMARYIKSVNLSNTDDFTRFIMKYADDKDYMKAISENCFNGVFGGTNSNDSYSGTELSDIMFGAEGNDSLYGNAGADLLYGEMGNDYLAGGQGSDTYIFNKGDGVDTIYDYENSSTNGRADKIVFGSSVKPDDVTMERVGCELVIRYGEGDQITINDMYYYADGRTMIESIEFSDGTIWDMKEIGKRANTRYGTAGDDYMSEYSENAAYSPDETIYAGAGNDTVCGGYGNDTIYGEEGADSLNGGYGNDVLYGGSGADKLYAGNGEDILAGGTGSDYLEGSYGNDTYVFNKGDGVDTIYDYENSSTNGRADKIVFGADVKPDDVTMERVGYELVIRYGEGDQITINDAYYYTDGRCRVESVEFDNGSYGAINYDNEDIDVERFVDANMEISESQIYDGNADTMLALLVQDMSEAGESCISDSARLDCNDSSNTDYQLWVQ